MRHLICSACFILAIFTESSSLAAEPVILAPAPLIDAPLAKTHGTATAILSGGCFWGMQDVFQHVKGVQQTLAGYIGGSASTAHYELVSTGTTSQVESLKITYDPAEISYGTLLRIFVSVAANPTELDYQGPDHGPQYRTIIWAKTPAQRQITTSYLRQLEQTHVFSDHIVTQVEPAMTFYPAEPYHQNFAALHPNNPYIAFVDAPKVAALAQFFPTLYRATPTQIHPGENN